MKISRQTICCFLVCLVLIISYIGYQLFVCFMPFDYLYGFMADKILSWNLRERGNYPEHQIIYVSPISYGSRGYAYGYVSQIEVGVYPYLDDELEEKIRDLGYPFNFYGITYVGTDNYDDISKTRAGPAFWEVGCKALIAPDARIIAYGFR